MRKTILLSAIALFALVLVGCSSSDSTFEDLPEGDAARGESLFTESINGAPACSSCHSLDAVRLVGPGLGAYGTNSESRVEGQSAEEYTYAAIVRPAAHIVDGYTNSMYTEYGSKLSDQDTADLIAFLLIQ